jgi:DNA-binding MarR family transcriptional regulator
MKEKYEYFIRRPFALIMIALLNSPSYKSQLMRKTKLTYCHIHKIVDMLNDMGLVEIENHRKINIIRLTDEGEKVAKEIKKVVSILR